MGAIAGLLDDFARRHPADAAHPGGQWYFSAELICDLILEAQQVGAEVLGLEGFLIADEGGTYPALGRITNFSRATPEEAAAASIHLMRGPWRSPPTPAADIMNSNAHGRYMINVTLREH